MTLGDSNTGYQHQKELCFNMELIAKRGLYYCGLHFVTLASILRWPEYFTAKHVRKDDMEDLGAFSVNEEINNKISLWNGDITRLEIDGIVNAANSSLLGGGGVDGKIHEAAGNYLLEECKTLGGCEVGQSKVTGGYNLPAKWVIHTVGPQEENDQALSSCYKTALDACVQNNIRTVAFPCISTGIFGYPNAEAAHAALRTTRNYLNEHSNNFDRIIFTTFTNDDKEIYETLLQRYFPLR